MNRTLYLLLVVAILSVLGCGTSKTAQGNTKDKTVEKENSEKTGLRFVQKVADNAPYQKNIVAKMDFGINVGGKTVSLPATLRMRKDDAVRIQLLMPVLGSEVGRLEFTPDYVLIVDRIHHKYVKEDYNKVDFLSSRGIGFSNLQSLFWNVLSLPGEKKVTEELLSRFHVNVDVPDENVTVEFARNDMKYVWKADRSEGRIKEAVVSYGQDSKSSLTWSYSGFTPFGSRKYPLNHVVKLNANDGGKSMEAVVTMNMSKLTDDASWESRTVLSDKYERMTVEEVMKLLSLLDK